MIAIGAEDLTAQLTAEPLRQHKALLNDAGIVIFPASTQHATVKAHGISYEDDYRGNALAAVFDAHKFEIRWHRDFSADRVKQLIAELHKLPELAVLRGLSVTYQGKVLVGTVGGEIIEFP
jgi:hypothetical protein